MNNRIIYTICLLLISIYTNAQTILKDPLTGNKNIVDRESIVLKPGFSTNGHSFSAKIDPYLPMPYELANLSDEKNFIHTISPQVAVSSVSQLQGKFRKDVAETVQYQDAMGRVSQSIAIESSPTYKDAIAFKVYDDYGRESEKYLPITAKGKGQWHDNIKLIQSNFYNASHSSHPIGVAASTCPWAKTQFDGSPLNRVDKQGSAGDAWQLNSGHAVEFYYELNVTSDNLINWKVDASGNLVNKGAYAEKQVYKKRVVDENENTSVEFTNEQGQVICKRNYNGASKISTYYVYDDLGALRYVLPPEACKDNQINSVELQKLCYSYKYDDRGRLIEKRLPGADWIYMVYDKRDRLVATQDGNLRPSKKWLYTKYDELDRTIQTGIYTHTTIASQKAMADLVEGGTLGTALYEGVIGTVSTSAVFSNNSFPNTRTEVLTETYYDNYNMLGSKGAFNSVSGFTGVRTDKVKGQVTGSMTKVLGSSQKLYVVNHYDEKYRLIQTYATNIAGGFDRITTEYDFVGKIKKNIQNHQYSSSSASKTILSENAYDHSGRLLKMYYTFDNGERVLMLENSYNELGELINKKLHNGKQEIDYAYNIRGWLTGINKNKTLATNRLFGMELYYNTALNGANNTLQYNGNISAIKWNHKDEGSAGHAYKFQYDNVNRLAKADYGTFNSSYVASGNFDVYGESGTIAYDLNGNIKSLMRNGGSNTLVDQLRYAYNATNQLYNVGDVSNKTNGFHELSKNGTISEYTYDANGNMTSDLNKGLNIAYNYLNLPSKVSNRANAGDNVEYVYSAAGVKLDKFRDRSLTNRYIGNFVYKGGGALDYIVTPEGRLVNVNGNMVYEYYLKDHLGNTRNAFQVVGNNLVQKQKMDYYPFGMQLDKQFAQHDNKYLYNGKELQDDRFQNGINLGWLDYGARMYDASLGRWSVVDPMAETYDSQSTYHFSGNNPILFLDANGMNYGPVYSLENELLGFNSQGIYGDAYVMPRDQFYPGMSVFHSEVVGTRFDEMNSWEQWVHRDAQDKWNSMIFDVEYENYVASWRNKFDPTLAYVDAGIGLVGGVSEVLLGFGSEFMSAGTSTVASVPMIVDGGVRVVSSATKLGFLLNGDYRNANALPGNIGGLAGKGLDVVNGVPYHENGLFMGLGGILNDAVALPAFGGSGIGVTASNPTLWNLGHTTTTIGSYFYSGWSNGSLMYNRKR